MAYLLPLLTVPNISCVTLTIASSAVIIINDAKSNTVENQISFPYNIDVDGVLNNPHKIECSFEFNDRNYRFVLSEKETRKGATSFNDLDEMLLRAVLRQINASLENEYLLNQSLQKERSCEGRFAQTHPRPQTVVFHCLLLRRKLI